MPALKSLVRHALLPAAAAIAALLGLSVAALAQKPGGTLRIFHLDNPPSTSIHEEFAPAAVVPFMPVFNNLVTFDPAVPQNDDKAIVPDLAESWSCGAASDGTTAGPSPPATSNAPSIS
jgi:peptide/nickel transport system substrate-binding protein